MCEFRVLEAADASRTLMSHPKHSNEDSSQEKDVGALQPLHAVLPGEKSVHSETARVGINQCMLSNVE